MKWTVMFFTLLGWHTIFAANKYVDVIATGANNGTSWANAWQDFGSINWGNISAGDTLFISGTADTTWYNDTLKVLKSGPQRVLLL